jgi:hypothetical protein
MPINFRHYFIFSPAEDFLSFWLPILASLPLLWQLDQSAPNTLILAFLAFAHLDSAHVAATVFPTGKRLQRRQIDWPTVLFVFLGIPIAGIFLFYYSSYAFFALVGATTLFHICRQQYGWMMLACYKAGQKTSDRFWDRLIIWNIMLFPILWWLSPLSGLPKNYFNENDLLFISGLVPTFLVKSGIVVHWIINILYVSRFFYKPEKTINLSKVSLLLATWLWFYGGLYWFSNYGFFFRTLILSHGISYLMFVYQVHRREISETKVSAVLHHYLFYLLAIALITGVWIFGFIFHGQIRDRAFAPAVESLLWAPILIHTAIDSFIWRKNMFQVNGRFSLVSWWYKSPKTQN